MRRRTQRGNTMMEAVLFLPIIAMLLWGSIEFARITWTYFTLQKILYGIGRYAATSTGINFCDSQDPILTDAKNMALQGVGAAAGDSQLPNLTAELISIRLERADTVNPSLNECECSISGCDVGQGAVGPDFIVLTITDGYSVRTNIPFVPSETFLLRPVVRIPYGTL